MGELKVTGNEDFLKFLLPTEGTLNEADIAALKYLVLKYPYCQPIHFAYLSALKHHSPSEYEAYLPKAALYAPRRDVLHRYIHQPGSFYNHVVSQEPVEHQMPVAGISEQPSEIVPEDQPVVETVIPEVEHLLEEVGEIVTDAPEDRLDEEREEVEVEEVIDTDEAAGETESEENSESEGNSEGEVNHKSEGEKNVIVDSIASSDYFIFNQSELDPLKGEEIQPSLKAEEEPEEKEEIPVSEVSKYDDDTMPYTFLWWLHKTRKEYAGTYQPFVRNPNYVKRTPVGELNQQIIENIFHIQPELNTFEAAAIASSVEFELKRKEDEIIEKFIKEEPQIRPPQANKLDTENKARRSSEDNLDLVSETLAKIYMDQMLYHKAIEIYRKLSLKFPDKKLYFAGQIEELEKKIS